MAPCCNNIVTPKMIRTGQVRIGDRIRLDAPESAEDAKVVSAPFSQPQPKEPEAAEVSSPVPQPQPSVEDAGVVYAPAPEAVQVSASATAPVSEPAPEPDAVPVQARITPMQQPMYQPMQSQMSTPQMPGMQPMQQQMGSQSMRQQTQQQTRRLDPITFSEMTPYLSEVQTQNIGNQASDTSISLPQSPMTGLDFTQTIDVTDVQAFTGFLSTQIGRYMRVEQLIGSNIVEDRFGFLVGIGTNFIILQEITTGNIMVLDLFTIRMTYIYYSQPIFPESLTV